MSEIFTVQSIPSYNAYQVNSDISRLIQINFQQLSSSPPFWT